MCTASRSAEIALSPALLPAEAWTGSVRDDTKMVTRRPAGFRTIECGGASARQAIPLSPHWRNARRDQPFEVVDVGPDDGERLVPEGGRP